MKLNIANRLRTLRGDMGMTQEQLAERRKLAHLLYDNYKDGKTVDWGYVKSALGHLIAREKDDKIEALRKFLERLVSYKVPVEEQVEGHFMRMAVLNQVTGAPDGHPIRFDVCGRGLSRIMRSDFGGRTIGFGWMKNLIRSGRTCGFRRVWNGCGSIG